MLRLASYLDAPFPIATILANRLWNDFERQKSDEGEILHNKLFGRAAASHHVASPARLLEVIKGTEHGAWSFLSKSSDWRWQDDTVNLSYSACINFIERNKLNTYDARILKSSPFVCLDGLKDLITYIKDRIQNIIIGIRWISRGILCKL